MPEISWNDFTNIEIRIGTIIEVQDFPEARNPAYKITVDFGNFGVKKTSAQITSLYTKEELLHKQVSAVVNFPPKQIANFMSECLIMGVVGDATNVVLLQPERTVENGLRVL